MHVPDQANLETDSWLLGTEVSDQEVCVRTRCRGRKWSNGSCGEDCVCLTLRQ